jgi:hypothetical protein
MIVSDLMSSYWKTTEFLLIVLLSAYDPINLVRVARFIRMDPNMLHAGGSDKFKHHDHTITLW